MPLADVIASLSPIHYWKLDEASGTVATDLGSNAKDLTYNNSPTLRGAKVLPGELSVLLNGSNQYANTTTTVASSPASMTALIFVRFTSTARMTVIGRDSGGGARAFFFGKASDGGLEFVSSGSSGTYYSTAKSLHDSGLHMIGFTYAADSKHQFIIDGKIDSARTVAAPPSTTSTENINIGRHQTAGFYTAGGVAHAAMFNRVLTAAEIAGIWQAFQSPYDSVIIGDSPKLYLPLNDASGTTTFALRGGNGTYVGSPTLAVVGPGTVDSEGISTDGADDYVQAPTQTLGSTQPQSFELWANSSVTITQATSSKIFLAFPTGTGIYTIAAGSYTNNLSNEVITVAGEDTGGKRTGWTGFSISPGWHHYVWTFSGTQNGWKCYIDGKDIENSLGAIKIINAGGSVGMLSAAPVYSAAYPGNSSTLSTWSSWDGLAAPAVYNYALTPEQVESHYTASPINRVVADRVAELGAVLHFPFDDTTGTVARATIGDDGVYSGATFNLSAPGPTGRLPYGVNKATGTGKMIGTVPTLGLAKAQTWEFWADLGAVTSSTGYIEIGRANDFTFHSIWVGDRGIGMTGAETVGITADDGGNYEATGWGGFSIPSGWHHHCFVFDGSGPGGWKYYLDGVATGTAYSDTAGGHAAGLKGGSWDFFEGNKTYNVAALSVYDRALTPAEIKRNYKTAFTLYERTVLDDTPVAYLPLDEKTGTRARNLAGSAAGTYVGSPPLDQPGPTWFDRPAKSTKLNGTSQYVTWPNGLTWTAITYECWIYHDASPSGTGFMSDNYGGGDSTVMFEMGASVNATSGNNLNVGRFSGSWAVANSNINATTGRWHHYVGTHDGTTMKMYRDGVEISSGSATFSSDTSNIIIGRRHDTAGANSYLNGKIAAVAIYNYALTAAQVENHYYVGQSLWRKGGSKAPMVMG